MELRKLQLAWINCSIAAGGKDRVSLMMIDLHCHMLPGIDDGAPDLDTALAMARISVADGIGTIACTPHIYAGLYENTGVSIGQAVEEFRGHLETEGIGLQLTYGADVHIAPDLLAGLRSGRIPCLHASRYFLLEPPHYVLPPRLEESVFELVAAGYVPVITHPERLQWVEHHCDLLHRLVRAGAWMQVTAGSLTGRFGSAARYWGEYLLAEGLTHLLATDAHGIESRPPLLAEGREVAERWLGGEEADNLVVRRPRGILDNLAPAELPIPPGVGELPRAKTSFFRRLFGRA
jgi:protein-tyrosine phosphatase